MPRAAVNRLSCKTGNARLFWFFLSDSVSWLLTTVDGGYKPLTLFDFYCFLCQADPDIFIMLALLSVIMAHEFLQHDVFDLLLYYFPFK